jgi:hypothetical protein
MVSYDDREVTAMAQQGQVFATDCHRLRPLGSINAPSAAAAILARRPNLTAVTVPNRALTPFL